MPTPDPQRWGQLSPLLDELLDLPAAQRAPHLARLRQADPALADELAALLTDGARAEADGFLGGALPAAAQAAGAGTAASLAGQRLGPYVLEAPLGQGGGGSVWRARREDGRFEGAVAVKLLHLSLVGQAGAERFRREGHILARLTHPHIARLLDAGVTPGGQPYLVLELVQGLRIDQHCDRQRLGVAARLALFDDVLAAVAHANTHGVIHRDLKPGNVLVTEAGMVKLLDFGIAKLLDEGDATAEATELTRHGGRALTPEYAAPEQLRGEAVTTATDVYALGVMLYQLLSGQHPTVPAGGATSAEVAHATLEAEPRRLSRAAVPAAAPADADPWAARLSTSPQRLQRALAGDLDNILARALRKTAAERYPTAAALADDLRRHRDHQPVLAQPDTLGYRTRKFVRRNRGGVAAGALLGLAIVAGVAGTVWQAQRAQQQARLAEQATARALVDLDRANAMNDLLSVALGPVSDSALSVEQVLQRGERLALQQDAATPGVQAYLLNQIAALWGSSGDWDKVEALLAKAQAVAVQAGDEAELGAIRCRQALVLGSKGDFDAARAQIDAALARLAQQVPGQRGPVVDCLANRSNVNEVAGRHAQALADADAALRLLGPPGAGQVGKVLALRESRASALDSLGQLGPAVAEYDDLMAHWQRRGELDTTANLSGLNSFAVLLQHAGQTRRALQVMQQVLRRQQGPGTGMDDDPAELANLTRILLDLGQVDAAVQAADRALAAAERTNNPRAIGLVARNAAEAHCDAGRWARCEALVALSARHLGPMLAPDNRVFVRLDLLRAQLALGRQQAGPAQGFARQAAERLQAAPGPDVQHAAVHAMLSRAALALGQPDAALASAEQALALARSVHKDFAHSQLVGLALLQLGAVHRARGATGPLRTAWQEAVRQLDGALGPDAPAARQAQAQLAGL